MSDRRRVSDPGRAAAGAAAAAGIVAAAAVAVWVGHKHPGLLPSCEDDGDIFSAGPVRDRAAQEWGDRWAIVTLAAAAPLAYALSTWLRAVWPERRSDRAVWIALGATALLVAGHFLGIGDALAVVFLPAGVVWGMVATTFGVIATAIIALVLFLGAVARRPDRRIVHWILLGLVLSAWAAIAFGALVFSDSTLC